MLVLRYGLVIYGYSAFNPITIQDCENEIYELRIFPIFVILDIDNRGKKY